MQDPQVEQSKLPEQSLAPETDAGVPPRGERIETARAVAPQRRERHTVRLVFGLAGLLGVAWAVAIVSRYPNLLAG